MNEEQLQKQQLKIQALKEKYQDEAYKSYEKDILIAKKDKDKEALARYKELVEDEFRDKFKNAIKQEFDYEVFMANALSIGYEPNGKPTEENDLLEITSKLKEFLEGKL